MVIIEMILKAFYEIYYETFADLCETMTIKTTLVH